MKTEKELEYFRYEIAKYMPLMPAYKTWITADQRGLWFVYLGLLETRYITNK